MVADLCMPVEVTGVPIVREDDGLAMSSRNRYLDVAQRAQAVALSRALVAGRDAAAHGAGAVLAAAQAVLDAAEGIAWTTSTSPTRTWGRLPPPARHVCSSLHAWAPPA